jgi:uncharacterized membrane protein
MARELVSQLTRGSFRRVFGALFLSSSLSIGLFLARASDSGSLRYWFLMWNLLLGWLPLFLAAWLTTNLKTSSWLKPANLALTILWLGFLPNSFYLISDLIHLQGTGEVSILYDVAMFFSFIFNGLLLGYMSIFLVHKQLLRRLRASDAHLLISVVFLLSGFAIYLGRYLRWNTWDVLLSPAGLLFDLSEGFVNPTSHPQAFTTTLTFFLLLGSMYIVIWQFVSAMTASKK